MAGKSDTFEEALLKLIFQQVAITSIADAAAAPATALWIRLHSNTLADTANGNTDELSYTAYAAQSLTRTAAGWSVTSNSVYPVSALTFPTTDANATVKAVSINSVSTGTNAPLYIGAVSPSFSISSGQQPIIATNSYITED